MAELIEIIEPSIEVITEPDILKRIELCGRVCYKSEDKITEDSAERFVKGIVDRGHTSVAEHAQIRITQSLFSSLYNSESRQDCAWSGIFDRMTVDAESRDVIINIRDYFMLGGTVESLKGAQHCDEDFMTVRFICDRGVSHELVRHRKLSFSQESTRYVNYAKKDKIQVISTVPLELPGDSYRWWETACNVAADMYLSMIRDGATPQAARAVLPNSTKTEIIVSGKLRWWEHMLKLRLDKAAHPQMRYLMEILNDEVKLI